MNTFERATEVEKNSARVLKKYLKDTTKISYSLKKNNAKYGAFDYTLSTEDKIILLEVKERIDTSSTTYPTTFLPVQKIDKLLSIEGVEVLVVLLFTDGYFLLDLDYADPVKRDTRPVYSPAHGCIIDRENYHYSIEDLIKIGDVE